MTSPPNTVATPHPLFLVRLINVSSGIVSTLAGRTNLGGASDGQGSRAQFFGPSGISLDGARAVAVVVSCGYRRWKLLGETLD